MHPPSPRALLRAAVTAAQGAGAIVLQRPRPASIESKTVARDLVSEIDRRAEAFIRRSLRSSFPSVPVIGEEGDQPTPGPGVCWYVDPVDGTVNHVHGVPHYSVSIGAAANGEVLAGVIYDPIRRELFTGLRGGGAFLNAHRLHVSRTPRLDESLLATGFPYNRRGTDNNLDRFSRLMLICHGVRRLGSACLDLAYVAAGRFDGYWELTLKPWDFAAGSLMVSEAGGRTTTIDGAPLALSSPSVLASNGALHRALVRELKVER